MRRVSTYCLPRNVRNKPVQELTELREAGLTLAYIGAESGDDTRLPSVNKGETFESTRDALDKLGAAGITRSVMLLSGLGGQIRLIAFITFSADIHKILEHIGVDPEAPRITPARGLPLWDDCAAQESGEGVEAAPDWDQANQSPPDYPDDQRTAW